MLDHPAGGVGLGGEGRLVAFFEQGGFDLCQCLGAGILVIGLQLLSELADGGGELLDLDAQLPKGTSEQTGPVGSGGAASRGEERSIGTGVRTGMAVCGEWIGWRPWAQKASGADGCSGHGPETGGWADLHHGARHGTFCSVVASCGPSARGAAGAAGRYRMPGGGPDFPSRPVPVMDPASCCCSLRGVPFIGQSWPLKWALLCRILRRICLRMRAPGWLQTGAGGPARRSVQPQRRAGSGWRSELQGLQHRRIGGPATEACEGRGDAEIGAHLLNVLCQ